MAMVDSKQGSHTGIQIDIGLCKIAKMIYENCSATIHPLSVQVFGFLLQEFHLQRSAEAHP